MERNRPYTAPGFVANYELRPRKEAALFTTAGNVQRASRVAELHA